MLDFSCQSESPVDPAALTAGLFETVNQEKTMLTLEQKMTHVETTLRRWHTRLTVASNKVAKLEKQRRKLLLEKMSEGRPAVATVKVKVPVETDHMSEAEFAKFAKSKRPVPAEVVEMVTEAIGYPPVSAGEDLSVPPFLQRSQADVDKMKAERLAQEAADKLKKPLSGKAALDYIKRSGKKK